MMSENIGLVLSADSTGIRRANRDLDEITKTGQRTEGGMSNLRKAFVALGAAISVGVFVRWIRGAIDAGDAANKTAQEIGITVESVQRLNLAFDLGTRRSVDMTQAMTNLNSAVDKNNEVFDQLGIVTRDVTGAMLPADEVLKRVADRFSELEDGAEKNIAASELFGRRYGPQMVPLLNQGRDAIEELGDRAERLGLVMDTETAQAAEEFNDNLKLMGGISRGLANQLAKEMLPELNKLTSQFMQVVEDGELVEDMGRGLVTVFRLVSSAGTIVAAGFQVIGSRLGALAAAVVSAIEGDFRGAFTILRQSQEDTVTTAQGAIERLKGIWSGAETDAEAAGRRDAIAYRRGLESGGEAEGEDDDADTERLERRLQRLRQTIANEEELEAMRFERRMEALRELHEMEELSDIEHQIKLEELQEEHEERMNAIRERGMTDAERIRQKSMSAQVALVTGEMGSMLQAFSSGNDRFIKAARVAGATQALIATATGQAEALKLGWPMGVIAAGKIGSAGAGFVSAIRGGGSGRGSGGRGASGGGATTAPQIQQEAPRPTQTLDLRIDTGGRTLFRDTELEAIIGQIAERAADGDTRLGRVVFTA